MGRKCNSRGCGFYLPDGYPLDKCPWHMAPGSGPVKIAAALTIAAAGFGGGFAYKKFRKYLDKKKVRKEREASRKRLASAPEQPKAKSAARKRSATQKRTRTRKRSATKSKGNRLNRRLARQPSDPSRRASSVTRAALSTFFCESALIFHELRRGVGWNCVALSTQTCP